MSEIITHFFIAASIAGIGKGTGWHDFIPHDLTTSCRPSPPLKLTGSRIRCLMRLLADLLSV